jgi:ABC-type multidrug transport system fused ATPase/permease subunit
MLRGDKGTRAEKDISTTQYMRRALAYARPYCSLILLACTCLLATSTANLLLPNFQGRILDDVIRGDYSGFTSDIKFYLGIAVCVGFFGAIRSLCFQTVGISLSMNMRKNVFFSIMVCHLPMSYVISI